MAEDVMRFVYDDAHLSRQLKTLRHGLTQALLGLPVSYAKPVEARSSIKDVGRGQPVTDQKKTGWKSLVVRNLKRTEEALRVLEEASGVIAPRSASKFERIRFRVYELEKRIVKKLNILII